MTQTPSPVQGLVNLTAAPGMLIHRRGDEGGYHGHITVREADVELYEEVPEAEKPAFTDQEYRAKVRELIAERYTTGDEIAIINNTGDGNPEHEAERAAYMAFRDECKARAKDPALYAPAPEESNEEEGADHHM